MTRLRSIVAVLGALPLVLVGCSGEDASSTEAGAVTSAATASVSSHSKTPGQKTGDYCAHNNDPRACKPGTYKGPHVAPTVNAGHWDATGKPINGGPVGADGSTGNNLTQEHCAKNEDPGCPMGSYVGKNAIKNPDGSNSWVKCEGTVCTNPNHGGGESSGHWDANGNPINGGPTGADGSSGNRLTQKYCAQNQDPACPTGSYVAPRAIKSPDGSNAYVPCEGTICTNPNHGAGSDPTPQQPQTTTTTVQAPTHTPDAPPEPGQTEFSGPGDDPTESDGN